MKAQAQKEFQCGQGCDFYDVNSIKTIIIRIMKTSINESYSDILTEENFIGKGAFGKVYKIDDQFALKVLSKRQIQKHRQQNNVKRQIQILQAMKNKKQFICQYYDCEEDHEFYYLKFKLYRSGTLKDIIIKQWLLIKEDPSIGVKLALQCLFGLSYLHEKSFVHRDFKPENILVEEQQGKLTIKISDFGSGKLYIKPGMSSIVGTNIYMAPQIWKLQFQIVDENDYDYDTKCDIWSLGITIAQMYMGWSINPKQNTKEKFLRNPFWETLDPTSSQSIRRFYNQIIRDEGVCLPKRMPQFLRKLVRKMLIPDPKYRISFKEVYEYLMSKTIEVFSYFNAEQRQKYLLKMGECLAIEKSQEVNIHYNFKQAKKMKRLYQKIYLPFKKELNLSEEHYILLQFMYSIIKFIQKLKKQLIFNKWDKEEIYNQISKQEFKSMKSLQALIDQHLSLKQKSIKNDEELSQKKKFKEIIMKMGNKVNNFIHERFPEQETIIHKVISESIYDEEN